MGFLALANIWANIKRALFVWLFVFFGAMEACTGDCASCHPNLDYQNDIRHAPMANCKTCHTPEKMAAIDMGGCGQDCFACHDINKIQAPALTKEHSVINSCIACHASLLSSPLNTGENVFKKGVESFSSGVFGK